MRTSNHMQAMLLASTAALIWGASAASAAAQTSDAPTDQGYELGEIVVTAQKREQSLRDVPMSITALSGDQLAARGVSDVAGLVKVTPGLSFVESGSATPVFSLRGVGFFDTTLGARPTVSVYQDEVPLPFSIMATGASLDLGRVEVLKGPQGTLFGQNSTGGAINYVAAKPTDEFEAGADLSYGRFNTVDASGFLSGALAPTLKARASVRVLGSDDWQQSLTRDDSLGAKRLVQGRLRLDWAPLDELTVIVNLSGFQDKSDTQAAQLVNRIYSAPAFAGQVPIVASTPSAPNNNRAADWDAGTRLRRDNSFYQLSVRGDYRISEDLTLTSITAYSRMDVDQLVDQDGTPAPASLTGVNGRLDSFFEELRLGGTLGPATFVVGANYSIDKSQELDQFRFPYTTSSYSTVPGRRTDASDLDGRQRFITRAVFGNVDWAFTEDVTAHAGLRYTEVALDAVGCARAGNATSAATYSVLVNTVRGRVGLPAISIPPGGCVSLSAALTPGERVDNLKEDNVSWRVGLDWKPAPQTLVYANVSRGYKSGSAPTIPAIEQSELSPVTQESVLAYEAGFKAPIIRGALEATGALFYYDYEDKQLQGRKPTILGVLPALVNVPKSRIKGAEVQLNAYPTDGLTVSVGGTWIDSEVTKDFNNFSILGVAANFKGNDFPYTPKYQLVADGQYERPLSEDLYGVLGANVNYRSGTNAGFGEDSRLDIKAYTLVDLRAGVRAADRSWQVTGYVRNITNAYYWTNVARLSDVIRRYTGEPRTYGVQLSARF